MLGHLNSEILCNCGFFLIQPGAHVDLPRKDGTTPLIVASANGHFKLVDLLIKYQSDKLAARTTDGATALHLSSSKVHVEVVKTLTKRMSRVELRTVRSSKAELSPGNEEVAQILKKTGVV